MPDLRTMWCTSLAGHFAERSDPRSAVFAIRNRRWRARGNSHDGWTGDPGGGETLHVGLSRVSAVHPNKMWRWVSEGGGGYGEKRWW
jgi:hypothetical protein